MEARLRKRTGYMRGEMRSGGECARATEMPATATEAANGNAAAMKAAAAAVEATAATAMKTATTAVEATAAAAMKTATTAAATMKTATTAASRAGIRRGGQQHRASKRGNA
jgi:hypothetical protein